MAQNEVIVKFRITEDGNLEGIASKADKAAKSTDNLNKSRNRYSKTEKGVGQLTSNSTKAFSKQASGISSGLVPAYATLAANVFAVSAAFNALERAIQAAKLEESLVFLSRQAGDNFAMLADRLREVTGNALSAEEALRATAFATTSGFNSQQLEKFGKIADGASKALGRSMPDALDRLVRGAAKLEPEILDELGIMVRLDDAAQKYADSIGKTVGELSVFERRMAFANEIMDQGIKKYGDLNEAVEVSPFQRLAAAFSDATIGALKTLSDFVGPFASILADNMLVLGGTIAALGTSVATSMVPALVEGGDAMADLAAETADTSKQQLRSLKSFEGAPKIFDELSEKVANGTATNEEYAKLKNSLAASERGHVATLDRVTKSHGEGSKVLERKITVLGNVRNAQATLTAAELANTQATHLNTRADILNAAAKLDLRTTLTLLNVAWTQELAATTAATAGTALHTKALAFLRTGASLTVFSLKALAIATMAALPIIGAVAVAVGLLYTVVKDLFSEPPSALDEALERSAERMKELAEISDQFIEAFAKATNETERFEAALNSTAGIIRQTSEQLTELISVQRQEQTNQRVAATIKKLKAEAQLNKILKARGITLDQLNTLADAGSLASERSGRTGGESSFAGDLRDAVEARRNFLAAQKSLVEAGGSFMDPLKTAEGMLEFLISAQANLQTMRDVKILEGSSDEAEFLTGKIKDLTDVSKDLADVFASGADEATVTAAVEKARASLERINIETQDTKTAFTEAEQAVADFVASINKNKRSDLKFQEELDGMKQIIDLLKTEDLGQVIKQYEDAFKALGFEGLDPAEAKTKFKEVYKNVREAAVEFAKEPLEVAYFEAESQMMSAMGQDLSAVQAQREAVELQILNRVKLRDAAEALGDTTAAAAFETERQKLVTKELNLELEEQIKKAERLQGLGASKSATNFNATLSSDLFKKSFTADETSNTEKIGMLRDMTKGFTEDLKALGPEGAAMAAISEGVIGMTELFTTAFEEINERTLTAADGFAMAGAAISMIGNMYDQQSKAAISSIDKQIAAEKKRDGQSAQSVAKIAQLEKKKEKMERKAFETKKKFQTASAIMSTAAAIAGILSNSDTLGPFAIPLAVMVGALGAAQVAVIQGQTFEGGGSSSATAPSKVSVGNRKNTVDLARGNSPSGELAYARGASGTGSGMTNFRPTPSFTGTKYRAAGGNTAFMVGEQGPEMFVPDRPGTIVPADETEVSTQAPLNINFSINAVDGQSVEEMLLGQRGNIIGMIREAANGSGETFLESVNVLSDQYQTV